MSHVVLTAYKTGSRVLLLGLLLLLLLLASPVFAVPGRQRISLNAGWRFSRFTSNPDSLSYGALKPWMLPVANGFINDHKYSRPSGAAPGGTVCYAQSSFNDSSWEAVVLPHDWAIKGPFKSPNVGTNMATLPVNGVGWYRRTISRSADEEGKSFLLDIDGAMSYASVWLNGNLVGGWPYGYASFRVDLTTYIKTGDNLLAVRVDNPTESSRWYPGGGLYRNVWLVKTDPVRVAQYGTYVTTPSVSSQSANVSLVVEVENSGNASNRVEVVTEIHKYNPATRQPGSAIVATFPKASALVAAGGMQSLTSSVAVTNPRLWGPAPAQKPDMYIAITTLRSMDDGLSVDIYQTPFGIRSVTYDPNKGILVNGQSVRIQGTNNHHDHGSIGAAFNVRAAERQLRILQEMGSNALRTSHNPPAPEYLDLADRMGMLVLDEIFDCWNVKKRENDFHLIFADWKEPDLRLFIRRDRNHPSVIAWSIGNEVEEQTHENVAAIAQPLHDIAKFEDPTRPVTTSLNAVSAGAAIANVMDIESLNYLGEGMGSSNMRSAYPAHHSTYPNKMLWSTETAAAVSTRGTFFFPPTTNISASSGERGGGNSTTMQLSAYELYAMGFGSSADKVFVQQDKHPYVAGEFVWTGFDYLGEPVPYESAARSSFFGIVDLAGFKKDRFYLYQARWRPDFPMVHLLPHWTWPDRVGQATPVHVFSAADEVELFVNGKSAGRQNRTTESTYRFRWDSVVYQPGDLRAVAYKNGQQWAVGTTKTVGSAAKLNLSADRAAIAGDGYDLSFITAAVTDSSGDTVPRAANPITFAVSSPGRLVSTDNGDPTDLTAFPSPTRKAYSGLALAVVRFDPGASGEITVSASSPGLTSAQITLRVG